MRKALWIVLPAVPLLGTAFAVVALHPPRTWTSDSAEAIAELERGRQAETKLYKAEATARYKKALELDRGFAAAKLLLAVSLAGSEKEHAGTLFDEVRAAKLDRLTAQEQFLVRYYLARHDRHGDEAERVLASYLAEHPRDASALFSRCTDLWLRQEWQAAEECNQALLEVDPNWVLAYNYLGYIAMAQGRFAEAEKNFKAYRYIAPDQANPYDSLGELYTVTGRYEEATASLNEALRLRPDFCASYQHLLLVANLTQDASLAGDVIARAAAGGLCDAKVVESMRCGVAMWARLFVGDPDGAWRAAGGECRKGEGDVPVFLHRAAVLSSRLAEAKAIEDELQKHVGEAPGPQESGAGYLQAALAHMQGVRLISTGAAAQAVPLLDAANEKLGFNGEGQGVFKLVNELTLAEALRLSGSSERADEVLAGVTAINPRIAAVYGERSLLALTGHRPPLQAQQLQ